MRPAQPDDEALAADFAHISRTLLAGADVEATLELIIAAGVRVISGCRYAGVFIVEDGKVVTVASSDPLVEQIDRLQMQTGEGACLDAVHGNTEYRFSGDLTSDPAYPQFGPQAASLGIRSVIGLRLMTDRRFGALNLYSDAPHAFGTIDRAKAVILANHCSTALDAAQTRAAVDAKNQDNLQAALASREIIGQAQGILMERERITAERSFDILRQASQDLNVKLRDIAQRLVDSGEDPSAPVPPAPPES